MMWAGVLAGALATPATFVLLGGNAFGPPKAAVFVLSCTFVALAFFLDAGLRSDAWEIVRSSRIAWAGAALVGVALLAAVFSGHRMLALTGGYPDYRGALLVLGCAVLGAGAAVMRRRDDVAWLWRGTSLLVVWVVLVAVGERIGLPPASLKLAGAVRAISTAGNASNLGVLLAIGLPIALGSAVWEVRAPWRLVGSAAWVGGLAVLVWTQTRGAWAGALTAAAVGATVLWLTARGRDSSETRSLRSRWALVAATGLVAIIVATALAPGVIARATSSFDVSSSTAAWRLSTWRSAARMTADRPILGFGPGTFKLAYPAYKEAGQDDGRLGYVPTESAHNVALDTSVSFGLLGLAALILIVAGAAVMILRGARGTLALAPPPGEIAPIAAALAGGFAALQFHYITLDTAPLLSVLLGTLVAWDMPRKAERGGRAPDGALRAASAALALVFALSGFAALTVIAADSSAGRVRAMAIASAPWSEIRATAESAQRRAPWESAFFRAEGRAAGMLTSGAGDSEAASDGMTAYAEALRLSPQDPVLMTEQARLVLAAAVSTRDAAAVDRAGELFAEAAAIDPNSGIPLAGVGRVALVRGRFDDARDALERAVELSPLYAPAWTDLGHAYRELGEIEKAAESEARAAHLEPQAGQDP